MFILPLISVLNRNMSFDTINIDIWGGELKWHFCHIFCPGLYTYSLHIDVQLLRVMHDAEK